MERPAEEIERVVQLLTSSPSPDVQQATIRKYFASDAGFRHPLCSVKPGHNSHEEILGIFQWYRIMSPHIELIVDKITYDAAHSILFLDVIQVFHIRYSPLPPARTRLLTRLTLREANGRHYIAFQEDFYHPDDLCATIVPLLAKPVDLALRMGGFACGLFARVAQAVFGVWRPRTDR
ncbi:hypothetical protein BJV78DRAFT_84120 [Lactifluus subvellereus]|nr:hypothetical protein BJV78DRAFT_84120 [Lactifluus subvellereus]